MTGPSGWDRVRITTMSGLGGGYLYANWDGTARNNLHDLAAEPPTMAVACVHTRVRRPGVWARVRRLMRGRSLRV